MDTSRTLVVGSRSPLAVMVSLLLVVLGACSLVDDTTSSDDDGGAPASMAIPDLVDEVAPAVVAIEVTTPEGTGQGSGAVLAEDGLVVTNEHVAGGAEQVVVVLADGSREPAEVIATDAFTDLAILRIERDGLPTVELAEEPPRIGEPVVSIGNPLGFENTVSAGIVSGLQRSIPQAAASGQQALVDLIQTDAAISPGSSGGVLVARDGRVVGINVAYLPPQSGAVSLGFAIPAPTVRDVVDDLLDDGSAEHPYLGVRVATITSQLTERFAISVSRGVLVVDVEPDGPAATGGLAEGDAITSVGGTSVATIGEFLTRLRQAEPGGTLEVTVASEGEERTLTVPVGTRPTSDGS